MKKAIINGKQASYYYVDREGNIFSKYTGELRKLTPYLTHDGYRRIQLSSEFDKKHYRVARIIAETYLSNPNNYPIINHKNSIRDDDRVENLEWCDNSHNQKQRFKYSLGTKAREVAMIDVETNEVINIYDSPIYAYKELGIQAQNISKVCLGKRKTAGGYKWKYTDRV